MNKPYQSFFRSCPPGAVLRVGNGAQRSLLLSSSDCAMLDELDRNVRIIRGLDDQSDGMRVVQVAAWAKTPESSPRFGVDPPNILLYGETTPEYFGSLFQRGPGWQSTAFRLLFPPVSSN